MREFLYDESEVVNVRFFGFATKEKCYDLGIVYTTMFFNHPLVICMQTGRVALLTNDDIENHKYIKHIFELESHKESNEIVSFLKGQLPEASFVAEVELN